MIYDTGMPAQKPIPVRLSTDVIARLDAVSSRMGTNRAALIRFLTDQFLKEFEKAGAHFSPVDFHASVARMDGRHASYKIGSNPAKASDTAGAPPVETVVKKSSAKSNSNKIGIRPKP